MRVAKGDSPANSLSWKVRSGFFGGCNPTLVLWCRQLNVYLKTLCFWKRYYPAAFPDNVDDAVTLHGFESPGKVGFASSGHVGEFGQ